MPSSFLSHLHLNGSAFIRKLNLIMDIVTILLCLLIESILYFWFLFLAIDMFEVNDTSSWRWLCMVTEREKLLSSVFERTVAMTSACAGFFSFRVINCQQKCWWSIYFSLISVFWRILENLHQYSDGVNRNFFAKNFIESRNLTWISFFVSFLPTRQHTFSTVISAIIEALRQLIRPQDYWGIWHVCPTTASGTIISFCSPIWVGNDNKWKVRCIRDILWENLWNKRM